MNKYTIYLLLYCFFHRVADAAAGFENAEQGRNSWGNVVNVRPTESLTRPYAPAVKQEWYVGIVGVRTAVGSAFVAALEPARLLHHVEIATSVGMIHVAEQVCLYFGQGLGTEVV